MKTTTQIQRMLADRRAAGFEQTSTNGDRRRNIEYQLLRDILELHDNQDVCRECTTIEDPDEDWTDPGLCADCSDTVQLRLTGHAAGGMVSDNS